MQLFFFFFCCVLLDPTFSTFTYPLADQLSSAVSCWGGSLGRHLSCAFPNRSPGSSSSSSSSSLLLFAAAHCCFSHFLLSSSCLRCSSSSSLVFSGLVTSFILCSSRRWACNCSTKMKSLLQIQHFPVCILLL